MDFKTENFDSIWEFYPYYLSEHSNPVNRLLHFIGTMTSIVLLIYFLMNGLYAYIPICLVIGYAFAWIGHFGIEKNRPATFKHPFYSFGCDFIMAFDILRGKVKLS